MHEWQTRADDSDPTRRADVLELRADRLAAPTTLPEGGLRGEMIVATADEVLQYADASYPSGVRREYVPRSTLEDPEWIDSLKLRPLIVAPPEVHWSSITPDNIDQYRVGQVGESIRWDAADQVATYVADTRAGLTALESGLRSVSVGYSVEIDRMSGTAPNGQPYDVKQTKRLANHVILTARGRVQNATIRADSQEPMMDLLKLSELLAKFGLTVPVGADEMAVAKVVEEALEAKDMEIARLNGVCEGMESARGDAVTKATAELASAVDGLKRGDGADFLAAYAARADLLALAGEHGVENGATLDTTALRKAIAVKLGCRADADDAHVGGFIAGALKALETAPKVKAQETPKRGDADDVATVSTFHAQTGPTAYLRATTSPTLE